MKIFTLMAQVNKEIPEVLEGGGKGTVKPIATPPPLAPPPETMATLQTTPEDVTKKKAQTLGAKSLQIPLGGIDTTTPMNV